MSQVFGPWKVRVFVVEELVRCILRTSKRVNWASHRPQHVICTPSRLSHLRIEAPNAVELSALESVRLNA